MPNYVRNIVKMEGITDLPLFEMVDGEKHFNFNKLIPMPEELCVASGSMTDEGVLYYLTRRCSVPICELGVQENALLCKLVHNMYSDNWHEELLRRLSLRMKNAAESEKKQLFDAGKQYISNFEKYGAPTWYEWCCREWGTKWNACDTQILDSDTIRFDTAWSNPAPIIRKLGQMYPNLEIEHWWADEDVGSNTGIRRLHARTEDVSFYEGDAGAYDIYTKCWGEHACVYLDDNGVIQRKGCDVCGLCA